MPCVAHNIPRILCEENLESAIAEFVTRFPEMKAVVNALPKIPLRARPPGFEGLAEIITAQQVSKASAAAIFERTRLAIQPFDAASFLAAGEQPLIAAGQSRAKHAALTALAKAIVEDGLDLAGLCDLEAEQALEKLTALRGIGPWTAEVFLLFCAGHVDVFPAGDVALQHATANFLRLSEKHDAKKTRLLAHRWRPMRGVAARILYAYYAKLRGRPSI